MFTPQYPGHNLTGGSFHKGKYVVVLRKNVEEFRKEIVISVEKVYESDSLNITLSDDEDPKFLCILSISRCDFGELKKQQGLLIDFDNFPNKFVKLLQQSSANNMFLMLQLSNPLQYYFEIVEHNEFKRLIHLSLKTVPASDEALKAHMADTIGNLKKSLASLQCKHSSSEMSWNDKCSSLQNKLDELLKYKQVLEDERQKQEMECKEIIKREKEHMNQERHQLQFNTEEIIKHETVKFKETINKKEKKIEEINSKLHQCQDSLRSLELQLSDKNKRISLLEQEVQSSHIEVATLKAKHAALERETVDRDAKEKMSKCRLTETEKNLREFKEQIKEMNATIITLRNEKKILEDRLQLSESLANKNSATAQATSEQLLKANQIISKQHNDLVEIKDKLLCRTHIAIEQEKVIERFEKEMAELHEKEAEMSEQTDKLMKEIEELKAKCEERERNLKERDEAIRSNSDIIQWLHKKLENVEHGPSRFHQRTESKNSTLNEHSKSLNYEEMYNQNLEDESTINFYGVSRRSNQEEDSPRLDPKYLRPTDDDGSRKSSTRHSGASTERNKENKLPNLPRVEYREKKSDRPSSFKSTPVSAYYPKR